MSSLFTICLVVGSLVLFETGCGGMSAAQYDCYSECSRRNDTCVVNAMQAATLQTCDEEAKQCSSVCLQY